MSVEMVGEVWKRDVGGALQQVLLVLANRANDEGGDLYMSQAFIAWKAKVEPRTVKTIFKELRQKRVLILVRRGSRRYGERRTNEYRLNLKPLPMKESFHEWGVKRNLWPAESGDLKSPYLSGDLDDESGDQNSESGDHKRTSSGDRKSPRRERGEEKDQERGARARRTTLSPNFSIDENMREWARQNVPDLSRELIQRETLLFVNRMLSSGKTSYDWFAEWCIWMLRKAEWVQNEKYAPPSPQQPLPLDGDAATSSKLKKPLPNCDKCHGTGMESQPGKGARRCACRTRPDDDEQKAE